MGEEIDVDAAVARIAEARHRGADSVEGSARHQADDDTGRHPTRL
jgi:hypothetical protein